MCLYLYLACTSPYTPYTFVDFQPLLGPSISRIHIHGRKGKKRNKTYHRGPESKGKRRQRRREAKRGWLHGLRGKQSLPSFFSPLPLSLSPLRSKEIRRYLTLNPASSSTELLANSPVDPVHRPSNHQPSWRAYIKVSLL